MTDRTVGPSKEAGLRRIAPWVVALVVVTAGMATAVAASLPSNEGSALSELHPLDVGTTWVYAVTNNGEPSGSRTRQVVAQSAIGDELADTVAIRSHYSDYPGAGPWTTLGYFGVTGDSLVQHAIRADQSYVEIDPPAPAYRLPFEAGVTWSYSGSVGTRSLTYETELVGIESVEVSGTVFADCAHYATESESSEPGFETELETNAEWVCRGIGPVRLRTVNETRDVDMTADLVAFHSPTRTWTEAPPPPSAADAGAALGHTLGFDAARSNSVPDAHVDLAAVAWSITRREPFDFAPVGSGDVLVTAEHEGAVTALDTATGEVVWRVRLSGPIVAAPVATGSVALVADADKNLWGLDMATGEARWVHTGGDQVSVTPTVIGTRAIVVREDRSITAIELADGREIWSRTAAALVRVAPAATGERIVVVDVDGEMKALRVDDGETLWSRQIDGVPATGPAINADGVVVVTDERRTVRAFDMGSGRLVWEVVMDASVLQQPALAGARVIVIEGATRLVALDAVSGDRLWETQLGSDHRSAPAVVGDSVVTVSEDGGTVATWNLATGEPEGTHELTRPTPDAVLTNDLPFGVVGDALVLTSHVDAEGHATTMTGFATRPVGSAAAGVAFETELRIVPSAPYAPPALVGDVLFVGGQDKRLYRSSGTSEVAVIHETDGEQPFTIAAGDVVLVQKDAELLALPIAGGEPLWSLLASDPLVGSVPAVHDGVVFFPEYGIGLVAVELSTGSVLWFQPIDGATGTTQPAPLPGGDVVYGAGVLARYDGATGVPEWTVEDVQLFSAATHDDGIVFVSAIRNSADSGLMAVDAESGEILWTKPSDASPLIAGPSAADGVVVTHDALGVVTAYAGSSGAELWTMELETPIGGSPYIHEGRVYLSEIGREEDAFQREFRIVVKDLRTGDFLGSYEPPGQGYQSFPSIGPASDGVLGVPATSRLGSIVILLRAADD